MRIFISFIVLVGIGLLGLAGIVRMEDKYPADEVSAGTCEGQPTQVSALGRQASALLDKTLEADRGIGIAAAVVIDGKLVWNGVAGKADGRTGALLSDASKLRIGSVSKPVTAALVARLAEKGEIDLDAPISRYVPSYQQFGENITMRMLAAHLSGIRHYDFANFEEANNRRQFSDLNEALAFFENDPLVATPGTEFHYSSFGYNLMGAAIENVTKKSFGEVLEEELSLPLGLESLTIDDPETFTPCRARFHTVYFGAIPLTTIWRNHSEAYPSAGVLVSAKDLASFAYEVFDGDFFEAESRALFRNRIALKDGALSSRTFGWRAVSSDSGDIKYYSHGGLTNGAVAELQYYPDTKMAVAVIANYNLWLTDRYSKVTDLAIDELPALFDGNY